MSSTPDHHPYLTEGCLRTPEDSADFLRAWRDSHNDWLEFGDAIDMLDERIERERRQACERGAECCERSAVEYEKIASVTGELGTDTWRRARLYFDASKEERAKALAFRAAARQP